MGGTLGPMAPAPPLPSPGADGLLRPLTAADVPAVLHLNATHVELLSPLDEARLERLVGWSERADAITADEQLAGFVLTFGPGSDYDSENYRWFAEQYGSGFLYLDRIVVDDRFRRRGLASRVYDRVEARAAASGLLALEVNVDPPNEPSLAFHRARGFVEVGTMGPQDHRVALMVKELAGR